MRGSHCVSFSELHAFGAGAGFTKDPSGWTSSRNPDPGKAEPEHCLQRPGNAGQKDLDPDRVTAGWRGKKNAA